MAVDDSYTKVLLHFNGSDASTTFTDESGKTWTANGDAQLDTAQKKFGTAAGLFDGTGDYITCTSHADFAIGSGDDFTIDFWLYARSFSKTNSMLFELDNYLSNNGITLQQSSDGHLKCFVNATQRLDITHTIDTDAWVHIALVRNSGTLTLYEGGVSLGSASDSSAISQGDFTIAADNYNSQTETLDGSIDEFRFSKGIARWTTDFTPPTETYANISVSATTATLTITPNAATVIAPTVVTTTSAALTITPQNADVNLNVSVTATAAALTITPNNATVVVDVINVWATSQALTVTPANPTISYDIPISATSQALTITPYDAAIWDGAAWTAWITANVRKITKLYYFVLTGDGDGTTDVTIPISSWQARRKDGEPTFLSVVVPGTSYQTVIEARTNGTMKINLAYLIGSTEHYRETIVQADYEFYTLSEGARNQSIVITGHKTESFTPKTLALQDVNFMSINDGVYSIRCASAEMFLNPGDSVTYDGNSFTANQVVYVIGGGLQTMTVNESES